MTVLTQLGVIPKLPRDIGTTQEVYNIAHLIAIADWLESHPEISFSMSCWSSANLEPNEVLFEAQQGHVCGSSACMVGWAPYALPTHFQDFLAGDNERDIDGKGFYEVYADKLIINPTLTTTSRVVTIFARALYTAHWDQWTLEYEGRVFLLIRLVCHLVNRITPNNVHVGVSDCSRLAAAWRCRYIVDGNFLDISYQEYLDMVVPFIALKVMEVRNVN